MKRMVVAALYRVRAILRERKQAGVVLHDN